MKILKKRVDAANALLGHERQLIAARTQLGMIKTQLEDLKTAVYADSDYPQSDKDYLTTAYNLVNHVKYTDFITFIQSNVG